MPPVKQTRRIPALDRLLGEVPPADIAAYVAAAREQFARGYCLTAEEARRVVDESMGAESLTDVLHKFRRDETT